MGQNRTMIVSAVTMEGDLLPVPSRRSTIGFFFFVYSVIVLSNMYRKSTFRLVGGSRRTELDWRRRGHLHVHTHFVDYLKARKKRKNNQNQCFEFVLYLHFAPFHHFLIYSLGSVSPFWLAFLLRVHFVFLPLWRGILCALMFVFKKTTTGDLMCD